MLSLQFFFQNTHFALNLFASLITFAAFWLYLDSWTLKKDRKELFRWLGFFLLSIGFLLHAALVEQRAFGVSDWVDRLEQVSQAIRLLGYMAIAYGLAIDPLPVRPGRSHKAETPAEAPAYMAFLPLTLIPLWLVKVGLPAGALMVGGLYLRRATAGLEHHLKRVVVAFLLFGLSEILTLRSQFAGTDNPSLESLISPFGWLWILEHLLLLAGAFLLGRWIWQYLVRRFQTQLFMVFTTAIVVIFLITTVAFTFLLFSNIRDQTLRNLETTSGVLGYAVDTKKSETQAQAQSISQQPEIIVAIANEDHSRLVTLTRGFLAEKKQSSLIITTAEAKVLLRAEDPERFGDSLSADAFIRKAAAGSTVSGSTRKDEAILPSIYTRSATPVSDDSGKIIGTVMVGIALDDSFVQGVKNSTRLESAIYAGDRRVATTLGTVAEYEQTIGSRESSRLVRQQVLQKGGIFLGEVKIGGLDYLAAYRPLKDINNNVVGMLFVGRPAVSILQTASRSMQLTFLLAIVLIVASIAPAYFVTRSISRQIS
jgi:hypothetical protein